MAAYHAVIEELSPSQEKIEEAKAYAFEQIREQVLESDPLAKVFINDFQVSVEPGTTDFTRAMQDEFENFFESKLRQLHTEEPS